ncbi:hypothetical protein B0H11DRAFT_1737868, partial [Mycena galericulata]
EHPTILPREYRLCRFCRGAVQDEAHALFDCAASVRLVDLRARFLGDLTRRDPRVRSEYGAISNSEFMIKLLASRKAIQLYAMYTFNVLNVFDETPCFFPMIFRIPGQ